jgi:hypothetical protein
MGSRPPPGKDLVEIPIPSDCRLTAMDSNAETERSRVGLCTGCRFAALQRSARGSRFWRCRRADFDPAFVRYPPLPVRSCPGFEPGDPEGEPQAERAASRRRA